MDKLKSAAKNEFEYVGGTVMANFVKWRGAFPDQGSPTISRTIQHVEVGQAYRFGIWGGDGLNVGPNNGSIAQMNPRNTVEMPTNNIIWYELVGLREANVMVEARNPGDNAVWDFFQLAVMARKSKARPPIRGSNYDYYVDTKGIGPDTNGSMVLTLRIALVPQGPSAHVKDSNNNTWISKNWSNKEWSQWTHKFVSVVQRSWSEKFWLSTPSCLSELEVVKPGGGKSRVHLHCVLKVQLTTEGAAQHRIKVVKAGATDGLQFRSDSSQYDDADLGVDAPSVTGFGKPFSTVIHEIGHTLGLHHPCETITPANPYCIATHPDAVEILGTGNELRPRYAAPWQKAAAAWFNSSGRGYSLDPSEFTPYVYRIAPADV